MRGEVVHMQATDTCDHPRTRPHVHRYAPPDEAASEPAAALPLRSTAPPDLLRRRVTAPLLVWRRTLLLAPERPVAKVRLRRMPLSSSSPSLPLSSSLWPADMPIASSSSVDMPRRRSPGGGVRVRAPAPAPPAPVDVGRRGPGLALGRFPSTAVRERRVRVPPASVAPAIPSTSPPLPALLPRSLQAKLARGTLPAVAPAPAAPGVAAAVAGRVASSMPKSGGAAPSPNSSPTSPPTSLLSAMKETRRRGGDWPPRDGDGKPSDSVSAPCSGLVMPTSRSESSSLRWNGEGERGGGCSSTQQSVLARQQRAATRWRWR